MGLTFLEVVLGALVAILITILIEAQRKPHLDTQIAQHADREYENRPATHARFLHLKLINSPPSRLFRWMTRETAVQCHGWISFHHLDGQNVFGRSMPIRWSGTPEPTPISVGVGDTRLVIVDPIRLTLESRVDVPSGEAETFDVAARFDDEAECYGWSNQSYFSSPVWRNPEWRLASARYLVRVTIVSAGQKATRLFRLVNDVARQDFRLQPPLKNDMVED